MLCMLQVPIPRKISPYAEIMYETLPYFINITTALPIQYTVEWVLGKILLILPLATICENLTVNYFPSVVIYPSNIMSKFY